MLLGRYGKEKMNKIYIFLSIILMFILVSCDEKKEKKNIKPIKLELKLVKDASDKNNVILNNDVLINNNDIDDAYVVINNYGRRQVLVVQIIMTATGKEKFKEITKHNIKKQIAILLDGKIIITPVIMETITGENFIIPIKEKQRALEVAEGIMEYKKENPNKSSHLTGKPLPLKLRRTGR